MQITVQVREVYGKKTVYPACQTAFTLAELTGQKTFSHRHLVAIEKLGYTINVQKQELPLFAA